MNRLKFIGCCAAVCLLTIITGVGFSSRSAEEPSMVLIPGGKFTMAVEYRWREGLSLDEFVLDDAGIRYRCIEQVDLTDYYIDKTEVTNKQFKEFLDKSGYKPKWPKSFLRHWENDTYPKGKADHPVIWVCLQDAEAYAKWAGKRLPTEAEWQKAAQGADGRSWPWGNIYDPNKANIGSDDTMPVASFPQGASPYGVLDMVGNVWEWTDSLTTDGYHDYSWLRGGSYYQPTESLWYMQGGPKAVYQRAKFLHMSPGLNRCATIGFRCVKDKSP